MTPADLGRRAFPGMILGALLALAGPAQAQSLRCNDTAVREGDSKVWLLRTCGQPAIADSYCARVLTNLPPPAPVPYPYVQQAPQVPCVMTDEWLYERGDGYLPAVIRIREGRIISIRFGEQGRSEPR